MSKACFDCENKKLHFFKALVGDFRHRLWLPPAVVDPIAIKESGNAILSSRDGTVWQVELMKVAGRLVFKNGWSKFIDDNQLEGGNFLVFKYDGDLHFTLRIFDDSCCEKEYMPAAQTSPTVNRNDLFPSRGFTISGSPKSAKSGSQPKLNAWDEALAFKSKNPNFMRRFTTGIRGHSYYVGIPLNFAKEHLGTRSLMVTLSDPLSREFLVRYLTPSPSGANCGFSSGWKKFSEANNLRDGDVCIFELIKEGEFHVHIFRRDDDSDR